MRAALYLRVSTQDQTTDNQERELRAAADRLGHSIVEVYLDHGISGAKGTGKTTGLRQAPPGRHPQEVRCGDGMVRGPVRTVLAGPCGVPQPPSGDEGGPVPASART